MKTRIFLILPLLGPLAAGCGTTTTPEMAVTQDMAKAGSTDMAMSATDDMAMPGDMAVAATGDMATGPDLLVTFPAPPALGMQIDRMGRAAVNTAGTDPFDAVPANQDMVKDKYNADSNQAMWVPTWASAFIPNLGVYDGLDGKCGNPLTGTVAGDGGMVPDPTPKRYQTPAGFFADDELYLDSSKTACNQYAGVELNVLTNGIVGKDDCGGRTPLYDVIDVSYSLLAAGAPAGVTDGVSADPDGMANATTFPFLGAPN